jgi:hypothetical protein|tara:strand:+ start:1896 stop:2306 length:411 start_codon:yes stop_codon:yes gene_type:complete
MIDILHSGNASLYAAKNYDNPGCTDTLEFYDDLKRFKYIKRLFNKYKESGNLKYRLILNHIIVIYNQFGQEGGTRLLFLKLHGYYPQLIPFLTILNRCPERVEQIGLPTETIITDNIKVDQRIAEVLMNEIGKANE